MFGWVSWLACRLLELANHRAGQVSVLKMAWEEGAVGPVSWWQMGLWALLKPCLQLRQEGDDREKCFQRSAQVKPFTMFTLKAT